MQCFFKITETGPTPRGMVRQIGGILRDVYLAMGMMWAADFRDKHFTKPGAQEYRYTARKGEGLSGKAFWKSYTGQKQKRTGQTEPLVYTGQSRERCRHPAIRATSKSVRVTMNAPTLNLRPKNSRIDMRAEMTTISEFEQNALIALAQNELTRRLSQIAYVNRMRVEAT